MYSLIGLGYWINVSIILDIDEEIANRWALAFFSAAALNLLITQVIIVCMNFSILLYLGRNRKSGGWLRFLILEIIDKRMVSSFFFYEKSKMPKR